MTNPHRGRAAAHGVTPSVSYGAVVNGRRPPTQPEDKTNGQVNTPRNVVNDGLPNVLINRRDVRGTAPVVGGRGGFGQPHHRGRVARGGAPFRGRGGFPPGFTGRGGLRGRGRGAGHAPAASIQS